MNSDNPTPRVGFAQLKNMIGRRVLFVGRVESMDGGLVRMAAPDGSKVTIQANSPYDTPIAEVQGVVVDPQTIREETHVNFGDNFGKYMLWDYPGKQKIIGNQQHERNTWQQHSITASCTSHLRCLPYSWSTPPYMQLLRIMHAAADPARAAHHRTPPPQCTRPWTADLHLQLARLPPSRCPTALGDASYQQT